MAIVTRPPNYMLTRRDLPRTLTYTQRQDSLFENLRSSQAATVSESFSRSDLVVTEKTEKL